MTLTIPPEQRAFVQSAIARGDFSDETAVVVEGLRLLERRDELRRQVDLGFQQIENGEFTDYDSESLRARFEEIKREGRKRLAEERPSKP